MSRPLLHSSAQIELADGSHVSARPITPADRDALADGFARLSARSRYLRFLGPKNSLSPRELTYLTEVDHVSHEAVVAIDDAGRLVGVARYAVWHDSDDMADVAVTVVDDWHGRGLGTALITDVVRRARANGIKRLTGSTLWENAAAAALMRRLGFRAVGSSDGAVDFRLDLAPA
jgi:RimJ/RimL family protein N-acetyltransferase